MKLSECSFLLIETIRSFNSANNRETLHQAVAHLNNIFTVARKNGYKCILSQTPSGDIHKLTIGIPGECMYHYNINKETVTANLKGERDEWKN